MSLSSDLISQFVKATKDTTAAKTEETVFGTVVNKRDDDGRTWVKLDGSNTITPVTTTVDVENGERVTVLVKDHTATITGNKSSPSARKETVDNLGRQVEEFDVVLAYQVNAEEINAAKATIDELKAISAKFAEADIDNAAIENLYAKFSELEHVSAKDAEILNAEIESLRAEFAKIEDLSVEDFNAANAKIDTLIGYTADFTYVSADRLHAIVAQIKNFNANYANIDFANITEAAIKKLFTDAGIIKDLVVSEGTITGELVGVTISGDLIKANTLKADKLVVKGSDGLYYKLNIEAGAVASAEVTKEELQNGLHGTAIIAKTITAEKIRVDDLIAFGATIGGFHINTNSIYSGVKSSVDNTTRGIYLDNDGQFAVGDESNYVKFYKDENNNYKLDISAVNKVTVGGRNLYVIKDSVPGYINGPDGSIASQEASREDFTSAFIPVTPGDVYQYQVWVTPIGDSSTEYLYMAYAFYDANKAFLGNRPKQTGGTLLANGQTYNIFSITVPENAAYIRVCAQLYNDGKIKLEKGTKPTDYTLAPEDMATTTDIDGLNGAILNNSQAISELKVASDGITAEVTKFTERQADFEDSIKSINESLTASMSADQIRIEIDKAVETVTDNGVKQIKTETGVTINGDGISVDKSGADTWTRIDENGMTVFESESGDKVLIANRAGVSAYNLHATTYLIIGKNSRFEDYQNGSRTGCFWIGN